MNHQQVVDIHNAHTHIVTLRGVNKQFFEFLAALPPPQDLPAKIEVVGDALRLEWAGFIAHAPGRIVRGDAGAFLMEYLFSVEINEVRTQLARFYLTEDGRLVERADATGNICDYNNPYALRLLSGRLLLSVLGSSLFRPAP